MSITKSYVRQRAADWNDLARRCSELSSELIYAGLPRSGRKMHQAVLEIGYEIAEKRGSEKLAKLHKKAREHEQL